MELKTRIQEDMKVALRAADKDRLATVRLILAAIKQREVDERIQLDDAQVLAVLEKMVKQRRESIAQFQSGGRADLVARENAELAVLAGYLPEPLSEQELDRLIGEIIAATGAASIKDMGKVMNALKPKVQGRADMGALGARIKTRLSTSG
ncbi:MAG: GatB/YqeY domain-containing protein [Gammaproteobacteria bacterium]|nr:GatB/YqeY domain-containing protein [Gammaproteobacteria bacterium]